MQSAINTNPLPNQTWRPLRLFNLYRIILSGMLFIAATLALNIKPIGETAPNLFAYLAPAYFAFSCLSALSIFLRRPGFKLQAHAQAFLDISAILLLIIASGGVRGGLGVLAIVSLASSSILLPRLSAFALAAYATLLMFGLQFYLQIQLSHIPEAYTHIGLLGAAFFATAAAMGFLADKLRASESLAQQRGKALADMQHLARYVIERMQTGVAVINPQEQIWLINESGCKLLGINELQQPRPLADICPQLATEFHAWRATPHRHSQHIQPSSGTTEILPRFAQLSDQQDCLIFLEDTAAVAMQAQQLKLASMGRLAGSIAHEIRNPLGAISHAGQLLAESPNLDNADQRLTEIIRNNCQRTNAIIENTLQLGRRQQAHAEEIELNAWLEEFVEHFCHSEAIARQYIQLEHPAEATHISFDASQLQQIVWNLCHNGARHSLQHCGEPRLSIKAHREHATGNYYLDICDDGPGIPSDIAEQIFEPFFTTEGSGTGLGLYIARELSECNHSHLNIIQAGHGGACFRLSFPDIRRRRYNT